jgi:hypothetical protein
MALEPTTRALMSNTMRSYTPLDLPQKAQRITHNAPIVNKLPDASLRGALPLPDGRTLILAESEDSITYGIVCRQPQVLSPYETQVILDEFTRVTASESAGLRTIERIGGGSRGRGLSAFREIVEGEIEDKAYVRPPLSARRGLKVIDDLGIEEGVD